MSMIPRKSQVAPHPRLHLDQQHAPLPTEIMLELSRLRERIQTLEKQNAVREPPLRRSESHKEGHLRGEVIKLWEMVSKQEQLIQRLVSRSGGRSEERRQDEEKTTVLFNQVVHLSKAVEALQKHSSLATMRQAHLPPVAHKAISSITQQTQRLSQAIETDAGRVDTLAKQQQIMQQQQERKLVQLEEGLRQHLFQALEAVALKMDEQRQTNDSIRMQAQVSVERSMKQWQVQVDGLQERLESKLAAAHQASEEHMRRIQAHIVSLSEEHGAELQALQSVANERQGSLCDGQRSIAMHMAEQEKRLTEKLSVAADAWARDTQDLKAVVRAEVKSRMKSEAKQAEQMEQRICSAVQALEGNLEQHVQSLRHKHGAMQTVVDRTIAATAQQLQDHVSQAIKQQSESHQAITHELNKLESRTSTLAVSHDNAWTKLHAKLCEGRSACSAEVDRLEQELMTRVHKLRYDMEETHSRLHRELSMMRDATHSLALDCTKSIATCVEEAEDKLSKDIRQRLDCAAEMLQEKFTVTHDCLEERVHKEEVFSVVDAMTHSLEYDEFKHEQSHYWTQQLEYNDWVSSEIYQLQTSSSGSATGHEGHSPRLPTDQQRSALQTQLQEAIDTQINQRVTELSASLQVQLTMDCIINIVVRELC